MAKAITYCAILLLILSGCNGNNSKKQEQVYKKEIANAEEAFELMAKEQGLQVAFTYFAADSAVINRGDNIIKGKNAIYAYYGKPNVLQKVRLEWTPDFIGVSVKGDLGYTYGKYHFSGMQRQCFATNFNLNIKIANASLLL